MILEDESKTDFSTPKTTFLSRDTLFHKSPSRISLSRITNRNNPHLINESLERTKSKFDLNITRSILKSDDDSLNSKNRVKYDQALAHYDDQVNCSTPSNRTCYKANNRLLLLKEITSFKLNFLSGLSSESSEEEIRGNLEEHLLKRYINKTVTGWDERGMHYWLHKINKSNLRLPALEEITKSSDSWYHIHVCENCITQLNISHYFKIPGYSYPITDNKSETFLCECKSPNNRITDINQNHQQNDDNQHGDGQVNVLSNLNKEVNSKDQYFKRAVYCYNTCGLNFKLFDNNKTEKVNEPVQMPAVNTTIKVVVFGTDPCGLNFPVDLDKNELQDDKLPNECKRIPDENTKLNAKDLVDNDQLNSQNVCNLVSVDNDQLNSQNVCNLVSVDNDQLNSQNVCNLVSANKGDAKTYLTFKRFTDNESYNTWDTTSSKQLSSQSATTLSNFTSTATDGISMVTDFTTTTVTTDCSEQSSGLFPENSITTLDSIKFSKTSTFSQETRRFDIDKFASLTSYINNINVNNFEIEKLQTQENPESVYNIRSNYKLHRKISKTDKFRKMDTVNRKTLDIYVNNKNNRVLHLCHNKTKNKNRHQPQILHFSNSAMMTIRMIQLGHRSNKIYLAQVNSDTKKKHQEESDQQHLRKIPFSFRIIILSLMLLVLFTVTYIMIEESLKPPPIPLPLNKWYQL